MKVKRDNLLIIAGVIWIIAGINIAFIGVDSYFRIGLQPWWYVVLVVGTVLILSLFHVMFGKLVLKHTSRIYSYKEDRMNPLYFFDIKSYLIMAFMIGLGVTLRVSGIVPLWFIASFYTGLGLALIGAGVAFIIHRYHDMDWSFHQSHKRSLTKQ